jgi:hypothetical protein
VGRLVVLLGVAAAFYVAVRTVEDRRLERRLASPVTHWPDVPVDPPEVGPPEVAGPRATQT